MKKVLLEAGRWRAFQGRRRRDKTNRSQPILMTINISMAFNSFLEFWDKLRSKINDNNHYNPLIKLKNP